MFSTMLNQSIRWKFVCVLAYILFGNFTLSYGRSPQSFYPISQFKGEFVPLISPNGKYVAVKTKGDEIIQIWAIDAKNKLSHIVWSSNHQFHNCTFLGMAWLNGDLIVSKVDSKIYLERMDGEEEPNQKEEEFYSSPGDTVSINPITAQVRKVLSIGYSSLSFNRSGDLLAAASPWNLRDRAIDFYRLHDGHTTIKPFARFQNRSWLFTINSSDSRLLGWDHESHGVFVIAPRHPQRVDMGGTIVYHIDLKGVVKEPLPYGCSVIDGDGLTQPYLDSSGIIWMWMEFFYQSEAYVTIDQNGIKTKIRGSSVTSLMPKKVKSYLVIYSTADHRFLIVQDTSSGEGGRLKNGEIGNIWQLDVSLRRRRKIATLEGIESVYSSETNRLLVRLYKKNAQAVKFGFLIIPPETDHPLVKSEDDRPRWEFVEPRKQSRLLGDERRKAIEGRDNGR